MATLLGVVVYGTALGSGEPSALRDTQLNNHVMLGVVLLVVMCTRFAWRLSNPNPVRSYAIRAWQQRAAISVHWFIYALIITQCMVGVVQAAVSEDGLSVFGLGLIEAGLLSDAELFERLHDVHRAFSNLIYMTIAIHVLAALYHQIFGVLEVEKTDSNSAAGS